jgi:hypothetical protein
VNRQQDARDTNALEARTPKKDHTGLFFLNARPLSGEKVCWMAFTLETLARSVLPNVPEGSALCASERRTLVRVAEALVDAKPLGMTPEDIAGNVERFLLAGRSRRAWRVRILLRCVEFSSLPRFKRRFTRLTLEQRRALILDHWVGGGRLGHICSRVRSLIILGTYGDPRAEVRTGYVPVHARRRFVVNGRNLGAVDP